MSHVRTQIRSAVFDLLSAVPGLKVFKGFGAPMNAAGFPIAFDQDLPGVMVRSGSEELVGESGTVTYPRVRTRRFTVEVVVMSRLNIPDDELDGLIVQVEKALTGNLTLDGVALQINLTSIEPMDTADEAASTYTALVMSWTVDYVVAENDPETPH